MNNQGLNVKKGKYLLDKAGAIDLVKNICDFHELTNMGLGNGFFIELPKRVNKGFKIILDENRITVEQKRHMVKRLEMLGFGTGMRSRGYSYYLVIY